MAGIRGALATIISCFLNPTRNKCFPRSYKGVQYIVANRPQEARMLGSLIFWIIVGGIAGALAKLIMPGDDPGGFIITILLGIAGAIVGGFLGSLIGIGSSGIIWSIIIATIGAIVLLAIYRLIASNRAAR